MLVRGEGKAVRAGTILADFDGTACAVDVAGAVCERFSSEGWQALDEEVRHGRLTLRAAIDGQATMLSASPQEMLDFALERFAVDPSFVDLVRWARAEGSDTAIVSDGFGFYVGPLLTAAGLSDLPVMANRLTGSAGRLHLEHPFAHPECRGCGTCKMRAVLTARAARGPVAFVGEGQSDRFGALYADAVFAKDRLAELCDDDRVAYARWADFHDVRAVLAAPEENTPHGLARGPAQRCPGWTTGTAGGGRT
jgi:2-hydroxy-3-keto-5-methylthiopentenyl-1-phosphate phosphatase